MIRKAVLVVFVLLFAPAISLAQGSGNVTSIENLKLTDIADDSIVVLSKQESGLSGLVNVKYAYVNSNCPGGVQLIDYYGPEFDPHDRTVRRTEQQLCSQISHDNGGDTE